MEVYLTLDHMEPTLPLEVIKKKKFFFFYLLHHVVIKPDSKSTKVRVVFNASRLSQSRNLLNDVLHTGQTLQNDLMLIISNVGIRKMYRQILVNKEDQIFQRILFHRTKNSPIEDFKVNTVTFGVSNHTSISRRLLNRIPSRK